MSSEQLAVSPAEEYKNILKNIRFGERTENLQRKKNSVNRL